MPVAGRVLARQLGAWRIWISSARMNYGSETVRLARALVKHLEAKNTAAEAHMVHPPLVNLRFILRYSNPRVRNRIATLTTTLRVLLRVVEQIIRSRSALQPLGNNRQIICYFLSIPSLSFYFLHFLICHWFHSLPINFRLWCMQLSMIF